MMRRRRPTKTIFSAHNVDQIKKFCTQGLRVENILEREVERIYKENPSDEKAKIAQLELVRRHQDTAAKISAVRLELASIMQSVGIDVHKEK